MTKLVIVLAVIVVVILVVVIVAVRNMRAEDPDEFADRRESRGRTRGGQDDRGLRYERRETADRRPGRTGRPAGRPGGNRPRPGASSGNGSNDRREQRGRGYEQSRPEGRGYDADRDFDQRPARGRDDRRGAPVPGPERRRADSGSQRRADDSQAAVPASRPTRKRSSTDTSGWDSSDWDKLSDVDYWAELASDKPLTTTAQPAAPQHPAAGQPAAA